MNKNSGIVKLSNGLYKTSKVELKSPIFKNREKNVWSLIIKCGVGKLCLLKERWEVFILRSSTKNESSTQTCEVHSKTN